MGEDEGGERCSHPASARRNERRLLLLTMKESLAANFFHLCRCPRLGGDDKEEGTTRRRGGGILFIDVDDIVVLLHIAFVIEATINNVVIVLEGGAHQAS